MQQKVCIIIYHLVTRDKCIKAVQSVVHQADAYPTSLFYSVTRYISTYSDLTFNQFFMNMDPLTSVKKTFNCLIYWVNVKSHYIKQALLTVDNSTNLTYACCKIWSSVHHPLSHTFAIGQTLHQQKVDIVIKIYWLTNIIINLIIKECDKEMEEVSYPLQICKRQSDKHKERRCMNIQSTTNSQWLWIL